MLPQYIRLYTKYDVIVSLQTQGNVTDLVVNCLVADVSDGYYDELSNDKAIAFLQENKIALHILWLKFLKLKELNII